MFVRGKAFQPSLVFAGMAGAYLSGAPLYGRLPVLPANTRLSRKGFAMDKHSSLLQESVNYERNKFMIQVPGLS